MAVQPATAQLVCRKLAVRFVSDQPDQSLVDAMAATWLANDSAIEPVLRTMITHPAFDASANTKSRRPLDYWAFSLRALDAQIAPTTSQNELVPIGKALTGLGQLPFKWKHPNGYPDREAAWLNTGAMLGRWNLAGDIVGDAFVPISYDISALRSSLTGQPASEIYNLIANQLVGTTATGRMRTLLAGLDGYLGAFQADLDARGLSDVTTVVMTEFGRRVAQNGTGGTDHGWGSVMFAFGSRINGGTVYGDWPGLAPEVIGARGDVLPTTDFRDVLGDLARDVLGVSDPASPFPGHSYTPVGISS